MSKVWMFPIIALVVLVMMLLIVNLSQDDDIQALEDHHAEHGHIINGAGN